MVQWNCTINPTSFYDFKELIILVPVTFRTLFLFLPWLYEWYTCANIVFYGRCWVDDIVGIVTTTTSHSHLLPLFIRMRLFLSHFFPHCPPTWSLRRWRSRSTRSQSCFLNNIQNQRTFAALYIQLLPFQHHQIIWYKYFTFLLSVHFFFDAFRHLFEKTNIIQAWFLCSSDVNLILS